MLNHKLYGIHRQKNYLNLNKHVYVIISIALLLTMTIQSGCAQPQEKVAFPPASQGKGKTTLTVFYSGENANWVTALEKIGDSFMREHSDIDLRFENSGTGIYTEALKVKEATNEFPDIMEIQDPYTFQKAGKLGEIPVTISSLVEHPVIIDGKVYAIPLYTTTDGIIYNQIFWKRYHLPIPKTYGDFLTICRKLRSCGIAPLAVGGSNAKGLKSWLNYFFQKDVIAEIPDWQSRRNQSKTSFHATQPLQMLKDYKSLMSSPYILTDSIEMNDSQLVTKLINGQFAMVYTDPSLLSQIIDAYPISAEPEQSVKGQNNAVKCRVGWFFLPDDRANPIAISRTGAQLAISSDCAKDSEKAAVTVRLFQYLLSRDNYRKILQVMYAVPTTKEAILYPAAGVQQRLLISYRYADKSWEYLGNNETPEWFTQSVNEILKSIAMNTISIKGAADKLDQLWNNFNV